MSAEAENKEEPTKVAAAAEVRARALAERLRTNSKHTTCGPEL